MKTRGILFIMASVVSILILLGGASGYAGEVRGITKDTIRIGAMIDLTGPAAGTGVFIAEAVRNYFDYVNSQGGINGRKLKVIIEDDRYSIPVTLAAFKKLVFRDKVFGLIGPTSTGGITSLFRHIEKENIPIMGIPVSEIAYIPPKRYIFGHCISTDDVKAIYHYILNVRKAKDPKIAIIFPDTEYGKQGRDPAREMSQKFGLKLHEEILAMGALDATSQVLGLKRAKPDYIIFHGPPASAAAVMRDSGKFGLSVKLFISTFYATDDLTVKLAKKASENFIGTSHLCTWYDKSPGAAKLRNITLKLRPGTEKPFRTRSYTIGWLLALIMTEGMKRAGTDLNSESMVEALESIKSLDTKGLCGPVTYSPNDRYGMKYTRLYKADVENNAIVPFTNWIRYLDK